MLHIFLFLTEILLTKQKHNQKSFKNVKYPNEYTIGMPQQHQLFMKEWKDIDFSVEIEMGLRNYIANYF